MPTKLVGFDLREPTGHQGGKPRAIARLRELFPYETVVMVGDGITDLEAVQDLRYSIRLVGPHGEENDPGIDTFLLRVEKDRAPILRVVTPSVQVERTARGVRDIVTQCRTASRRLGLGQALEVRIEGDFGTLMVAPGEVGSGALWCASPPTHRHEEALRDLAAIAGQAEVRA